MQPGEARWGSKRATGEAFYLVRGGYDDHPGEPVRRQALLYRLGIGFSGCVDN